MLLITRIKKLFKRERSPQERRAIFAKFAKKYKKGLKRTSVKSSNIHSVAYNQESRMLEVAFKNKRKKKPASIYRYADVSPRVFKKMMAADSKGKFFHKNIRGVYDYNRVS